MSILPLRWTLISPGLLVLTMLCGCVVADGGYGPDVGISYVGGYVEPVGYVYGGWGGGYHVGPPRGGEHGAEHSSGSYRAAPSSHRTPSIPTRSRGR
jgi:hypothetical protein